MLRNISWFDKKINNSIKNDLYLYDIVLQTASFADYIQIRFLTEYVLFKGLFSFEK